MRDSLPVTAIVPHRNRSIVANAIESILRQTAPPAEIIVVDDGSLPQHREALRKHADQARIVFLDKPMGPSFARNAGLEAASQEWVAFLDDDDEWLPGKLERQWNTLRGDPTLSAVAGAMIVVGDHADWPLVSHSPTLMTLAAALEGTLALMQTTLIRRSDIKALGGFDRNLNYFEDKDFWIRFTGAGLRGYYDRVPLAILNRRRMNRLTSQWWACTKAQFQVIAKHRSLYDSVLGPRAANRERSKCLRRAGLEKGGIPGRLVYAGGCLVGGALAPLMKLATTGEMQDVPYPVPDVSL